MDHNWSTQQNAAVSRNKAKIYFYKPFQQIQAVVQNIQSEIPVNKSHGK